MTFSYSLAQVFFVAAAQALAYRPRDVDLNGAPALPHSHPFDLRRPARAVVAA